MSTLRADNGNCRSAGWAPQCDQLREPIDLQTDAALVSILRYRPGLWLVARPPHLDSTF